MQIVIKYESHVNTLFEILQKALSGENEKK